MQRFDSKNSGTKLPRHITSIFCVDIHWKAFAAKKTVTPFVESVKNTQLSGADRAGEMTGNEPSDGVALEDWLAAEKELLASRRTALSDPTLPC